MLAKINVMKLPLFSRSSRVINLMYFQLFLSGYKTRTNFFLFRVWVQSSPTLCGSYLFLIVHCWNSVKDQLTITCVSLFLCLALFYWSLCLHASTILFLCLVYIFDNFVIHFEIEKCNDSNFVLPYQDNCGY